MALSFPGIFIASPPSSHSLRVNRRPVVVEKVSTLHFDASPASQRVLRVGIQHVLSRRGEEDKTAREVNQWYASLLCIYDAAVSERLP